MLNDIFTWSFTYALENCWLFYLLLYYITLTDLLGVSRVVILVILCRAATTAELEHLLYLLTEKEKASNENTDQIASSLEILKNFSQSKSNSLLLPAF